MKRFLNNEKYFLIKVALFIISVLLIFLLNWTEDLQGKLLFLIYFVISMIALFFGTLRSLLFTIVYLFFLGSTLSFVSIQHMNQTYLDIQTLSLQHFMIYGIGLLFTNLIGGAIHQQYRKVVLENNQLKQEVQLLVAVDPITHFDNAKRLELEVNREMKRVNRHGGKFTILFLQLDYYNEFLSVYGQKEMEFLLQTIGEKVESVLRFSDKKFRFNENKFAFILIETGKSDVNFVADKLATSLQEHKLSNGRTVTLEFHISYEEYNGMMKDADYMEFIQSVEKETVYYNL